MKVVIDKITSDIDGNDNRLYSPFNQRENGIDEPNGFINQPFGYHPKSGEYPDLYNHSLAQ